MRNPKDIIINGRQLSEILEAHKKWSRGEKGGERANLSNANLRNANLRNANLIDANLRNANLIDADLIDANLSAANLSNADLSNANLSNANLIDANLSAANLSNADLRAANLRNANLIDADLIDANLSAANLSNADLSNANLSNANLIDANLSAANLSNADLRAANLRNAKNKEMAEAVTNILPEGEIIGWKKCKNNVIVKLLIPSIARRSNATGRKCRAEYATVIEVFGSDVGITDQHGPHTEYRVGEIVSSDKWDGNRWEECSNGIHFFITRWEAENY